LEGINLVTFLLRTKFTFSVVALVEGKRSIHPHLLFCVSERKIDHNENPFEGNEKFVLFLDELAENNVREGI
jgi:hypothetical protein